MPDWLRDAVANGQALELHVLIYRIGLAFVLGAAVAGIYWATHQRDETFSPSFISTLVLLAILIAMVTQVIEDKVARAFALVGALSVVRFRTVVEDTRDTAFVIFSVVVGMAAGADHLAVALVGLAIAGVAAFVTRPRRAAAGLSANGKTTGEANAAPWTLTVRIGLGHTPDSLLEKPFHEHLCEARLVGSATGRQGAAFDLTYRVRFRPATSPTIFVDQLNRLEGVQNVELRRL
jgi:hypothetical protein